jgi:hypothetical protein
VMPRPSLQGGKKGTQGAKLKEALLSALCNAVSRVNLSLSLVP